MASGDTSPTASVADCMCLLCVCVFAVRLTVHSLNNLRKLRVLNLSNNRIQRIENLHHFPDLEVLILDFNPIQTIDPTAFRTPCSVRSW